MIRLLLIAIVANVFMSATEAKHKPAPRSDYSFNEYVLMDKSTRDLARGLPEISHAIFRSKRDCHRYKNAYLTVSEKARYKCVPVDPD